MAVAVGKQTGEACCDKDPRVFVGVVSVSALRYESLLLSTTVFPVLTYVHIYICNDFTYVLKSWFQFC